jgi:acetylornithine/N-succinyldiaminopimelate aminotransferase
MITEPRTDSPLFKTYARADLAFERGEGAWLVATDGTRYLDFMGGIAVNVLGHAHPHLVEALKAQAEKLWHVSNIFEIPGQRELGARLVAATFADRVFFTNSGAEAIEAAVKTGAALSLRQGRARALPHRHVRGSFPRPHAGRHRGRWPG